MNSDIIIYQNSDGNIKIDVRLEDDTVWLSQIQVATLFGKARTTITEHIQNVFAEGELDEKVMCREFRHTTKSEQEFEKYQLAQKEIEKVESLSELERDIKLLRH